MKKTSTDRHWNERAASVASDIEVNIMDIFQRELEYDYVCRHLSPDQTVLEVGCGNGFSTRRFREAARFVDAFDYAENMITRAKAAVGETNNRFFEDNILDPQHLGESYDVVVCVRVLINLRDLDEQKLALRNMTQVLRPGGLLILTEGFQDGFEALSELRVQVGLPPLTPAAINFYSALRDLQEDLHSLYEPVDSFHLGAYDFLTRVMYPLVAGPDDVSHNTVMSERCSELARAFNPDCFEPLSRVRGFILRRRSS